MNKLFASGLAAAMAVAVAGCSVTGGDLIRPGEPTATLIVINDTFGYLDAIAISDCDNFTYGLNRLSAGDSIAPGDARSFTLSAGCWDVSTGDYGGGEARQRMTLNAGDVMRYSIYE